MSAASKSFVNATPRERISQVVESWFLTEPLLFAAWTMHDVVDQPRVETIRVGRGRIEFNPAFIASLKRKDLRAVLAFEAMRILLAHPYSRRQQRAELSYQASNLTIQECLRTALPIPRAREIFGDDQFDDQYFEFYYRELDERAQEEESQSEPDAEQGDGSLDSSASGDQSDSPQQDHSADASQAEPPESDESDSGENDPGESNVGDSNAGESSESESRDGATSPAGIDNALGGYADPGRVGMENTANWEHDDLRRDEIQAAVREAAETSGWGTIGGSAKEQLMATLRPKLDYRGVLRNFRQSVVAVRRRLTRMKPSRRYGFDQLGSRYDFTTKLLFAVDVSGSMGSRDLRLGFSVISRFFQYGVESVDVIWFDEDIRGEALSLRRARSSFEVTGRGGTHFGPVMDYIDRNRQYDGLIVFTDGYAPVPKAPKNRRTRILWLFKDESTYKQMGESLRPLGRAAFLKESGRG